MNIGSEIINKINEEHSIRRGFDNSIPNHYKLELNGDIFEFSLYRDVRNDLLLMLSV